MKVYIFPQLPLCPKNNESNNSLRAQVLGGVVYIHDSTYSAQIHCVPACCMLGGWAPEPDHWGPSPALLPTGCVISSKSVSALRSGLYLPNVDDNSSSIIWVVQMIT